MRGRILLKSKSRTEGTVRGEPSLLELSRVVTEEKTRSGLILDNQLTSDYIKQSAYNDERKPFVGILAFFPS